MGAPRNSYAEYLRQFDGQISPERLPGLPGAHLNGAMQTPDRGGKMNPPLRYQATYRLADGRIAELYHSDSLSILFAWPNRATYDAYQAPMPYGVYHE